MPECELRVALEGAAREVLETMFFTIVEEGGTKPSAPGFASTVSFHGDRDGFLAIRLPETAARSIASNFLGNEPGDLAPAHIHSVVSELANMICGAALSRYDGRGDFLLDAPSPGWRAADRNDVLELPLAEDLGSLGLQLTLLPHRREIA